MNLPCGCGWPHHLDPQVPPQWAHDLRHQLLDLDRKINAMSDTQDQINAAVTDLTTALTAVAGVIDGLKADASVDLTGLNAAVAQAQALVPAAPVDAPVDGAPVDVPPAA